MKFNDLLLNSELTWNVEDVQNRDLEVLPRNRPLELICRDIM
jgi:hypothetical protein